MSDHLKVKHPIETTAKSFSTLKPLLDVDGRHHSTQEEIRASVWKVKNKKTFIRLTTEKFQIDSSKVMKCGIRNKIRSHFGEKNKKSVTLVALPNPKDEESCLHLPCWQKQALLHLNIKRSSPFFFFFGSLVCFLTPASLKSEPAGGKWANPFWAPIKKIKKNFDHDQWSWFTIDGKQNLTFCAKFPFHEHDFQFF